MIDWDPPDKFIGTTAAAIMLASAGVSAVSQAYGAHKAASGANYAADLQAKATQDALTFQREQSVKDQANFEQTQHANYDQWAAGQEMNYDQYAAREGRIGQLGDLLGMGPRQIPALKIPPYVSSGSSGPTGATTTGKPGAAQFIAQYQADPRHLPSEGVQPLYQALKAAGYNVSPYMYGSTPSNNEITLDGQKYKLLGGEGTPAAYWYRAGMNDSGGYRGTASSLLG